MVVKATLRPPAAPLEFAPAVSVGVVDAISGRIHAATSPRGIVWLSFVDGSDQEALATLRRRWPKAEFIRDDAVIGRIARQVFMEREGRVRLAPMGTNFQVKVWQALLELGSRGPTSYGEIAGRLGCPGASRAVGQAIGANPVAWLIPCHRVLRGDGTLGGYHWGVERKRAMLAWEHARRLKSSA